MKKVIGGLAALLMFCGYLGCSSQSSSEPTLAQGKVTAKPVKVTISQEQDREEEATDIVPADRAPAGDAACSTDDDCIIVPEPADSCIPCVGNATQRAVSKQGARGVMGHLKDVCMPKIDKLKNGQGSQLQRSQDQSCKFNGAKCDPETGTCTLANLSEKEMKARYGSLGSGQQAGGGGQGGFGPGGGQQSEFAPSAQGMTGAGDAYGTSGKPYDWQQPQGYGSRNNYPGFGGQGSGWQTPNWNAGNRAGLQAPWGANNRGGWQGNFGAGSQGGWPGAGANFGAGSQAGWPGANGAGNQAGWPGANFGAGGQGGWQGQGQWGRSQGFDRILPSQGGWQNPSWGGSNQGLGVESRSPSAWPSSSAYSPR